jgi:hypothetical protein
MKNKRKKTTKRSDRSLHLSESEKGVSAEKMSERPLLINRKLREQQGCEERRVVGHQQNIGS